MSADTALAVRHLVVRLPNWLGDTVMALPVLRALRGGLAASRITLLGPWASLLGDQGVADRCLDYPRHWRKRLAAVGGLRRQAVDAALLLPNSVESALAARLWGARWIIGYATDGRGPLLTHPVPLPTPRRHQVDEYQALLVPLGLGPSDRDPAWIPPTIPPGERIDALLPGNGSAFRPWIGIHPGNAFGSSKRWPAERFAAVARGLDRRGFAPVLLGAPSDATIVGRIQHEAGVALTSLVGKDFPDLLPGLLARLALLISTDTGVAHLAAALGVPVVTLFGPTDPGLTAPRATRSRVLWRPPPCAPCFLSDCPIEHPCLLSIQVDDVLQAVLDLLAA